MPFTLLHTADLHLGKSFSTFAPERAGQRRADLLATLARLCRAARERRVDLLCIAGDLFDDPSPPPATLAAASRALAEASVPVLLLPGNHDPLEEDSPYLTHRWPGSVRVAAAPGWQRIPLDGPETWAFGYARGGAHRSPWTDFPGCGPEALLALHAACLAPGLAAAGSAYPFTPAEIPPCAYLALGHHHRHAQVARAPLACYAGAPEPLEAETETTPATALLVTLDGGTATAAPIPVATRRHRRATLDVTGLTAAAVWERALAVASPDDLLTLELTGTLDAGVELDVTALRGELNGRCFAAEVRAALAFSTDWEGAEGVMAALREAVAARQARSSPDAQARLARAAHYAARALEGTL